MEGTSISHYTVEEKIGEGGMGVVYRATDTRLNRQVALKALPESFLEDPQRMARFEREAQLLASLNHTNIAGIHGLETAGDSRYLILELVEGETLAERMARGRLGLEEALGIAQEIAEALEAAHDKGIIHRDLKPANVKITPSGQVKVLDFGLAKALEGTGDPASGSNLENSPTLSMAATQAGIILGTAAYMAPEQAAGQPADRRADVWSFGVVLAEMLTGKQLFTGETASHVLAAVLQKEVDLDDELPDVPPPIRRLLERCLEKKPRRRLQAIGEARIAIEDYLADPAAAEATIPTVAAAGRAEPAPVWRRLLPWGLAAALLVAAIGLAVISRGSGPPAEVVQFTIPPPDETAFNLNPTSPGPVAVSPDGRHLVFAATGSGGAGLWVRSLEASEPRLLAGTEGAAYPFWAPDSRSIGFFGDSKLKRIDIAGGPAVSLTDADNGKGGSWSSQDVILFAPTHSAAIHRVAAAGGESTPVTTLTPERDISHRHPEFLPGGEHFIYLARINDPANDDVPEIRLAALDGAEDRVLLRSPSAAGYAAGYLLYALESTLLARPFDVERLEFGGDAVPVVDGVTLISTGAARSVFSASSTGVLTYQTGANESGAVLSWFDRSGQEAGTLGQTARYNEVCLSPDDRRLGVTITDSEAGTRDIWIFDLDRGIPSRFTFDPRHDDSIVWSPDGETVYFSSQRGGSTGAIYRKSISGTAEAELVFEQSEHELFPAAVTSDGSRLVIASRRATGASWDVELLDLSSSEEPAPFLGSEFVEIPFDLSPDDRWLLYGSDESGRLELYVTSFPQPGRKWQVTTEGLGNGVRWTRDGEEIVFEREGTVYSVSVEMEPGRLVLGTPQALLEVSNMTFGGMDLTASGERLIAGQALEAQGDKPLHVVLSWPKTIERR